MVVERNCVDSVNMVLEILESDAICSVGVLVVLKRLETAVLEVVVALSVDGGSVGAEIVMVL